MKKVLLAVLFSLGLLGAEAFAYSEYVVGAGIDRVTFRAKKEARADFERKLALAREKCDAYDGELTVGQKRESTRRGARGRKYARVTARVTCN